MKRSKIDAGIRWCCSLLPLLQATTTRAVERYKRYLNNDVYFNKLNEKIMTWISRSKLRNKQSLNEGLKIKVKIIMA